jgi:hypothetical protein
MVHIPSFLAAAMTIPGALAVGVLDLDTGHCIAGAGMDRLNLDIAAAGYTQSIYMQMRLLKVMKVQDEIKDILITNNEQMHLISMGQGKEMAGLCLFLALDAETSDIGFARFRFNQIQRELSL